MDPNIPTPPAQPEVSVNQRVQEALPKSHNSKSVLIALVVTVLIIVGVGGYYMGTSKETVQRLAVTKPTTTPIIALTLAPSGAINKCGNDSKMCPDGSVAYKEGPSCEFRRCPKAIPNPVSKYINPAGFSIVYINSKGEKIFENGDKIYIAPEISEVFYQDGHSQQEKTTLQLLENRIRGIQPYVSNISYIYKKINSDADLIAQEMAFFGNKCTSIRKKLMKDGSFSIEVGDKNNNFWNDGKGAEGTECFTNFGYDFVYSEKNKVAVVGNTRQNCGPEQYILDKDGYVTACGAFIEFP